MVLSTQVQQETLKAKKDQLPSRNHYIEEFTTKESGSRWPLKLNASLDIREVLNCFFKGINALVECAHLQFAGGKSALIVNFGSAKKHSAKYTLKTSDYTLGNITFTRAKHFSSQELKQLEDSLALLFYPLRNALLYQEALDNSLKDELTQIANRAAFELAIKREIGVAKRHSHPLCMLVVDIDHFKKVNDNFGHSAGDKLLQQVAKSLKSTLRETDQLFRFGGEEFVILLGNAGINAGVQVAHRALSAVAKEFFYAASPSAGVTVQKSQNPVAGKRVKATASIGVSVFCSGDTRDTLFSRADEALYLAKSMGRNRVHTEDDLEAIKKEG